MEQQFLLPELGENIEVGDVLSILVSVGDAINEEQPVLEIETDKAAIEVPCSVSGIVKAIHVEEGGKAQVGHPILTVETESEGKVAEVEEPAVSGEANGEESVTPEDSSLETAPVAELEPEPRGVPDLLPTEVVPRDIAPASPSVRRFAREIGIDINQVSGSGPSGRISVEDIKNHAYQINAESTAQEATPSGSMSQILAQSLPDFSKWGAVEREPMSNVRRATAKHMAAAWSTIPHVTQSDKADVTELEKLRKQFQIRAEAAGGKLTITAILLKVVTCALKQFPQFNASVDMMKHEVIYKKYFHIGVAVDTDRGLLVPVIRDVDRKNIIELSVELNQIAEKARNKKLNPEDMQGGSFTITNLGGIGGTHFSPIVNHPEVAILGVARGRIEPVLISDAFQPRLLLPLILSYDHRLIDGADAARFLRSIAEMLEEPFLIALDSK
jgi:pyruvate dehydrogenase E2 component (dihydrolipoamide acetyltransferase)